MQLDRLLELVLPSSAVFATAVSLIMLATTTCEEGHALVIAHARDVVDRGKVQTICDAIVRQRFGDQELHMLHCLVHWQFCITQVGETSQQRNCSHGNRVVEQIAGARCLLFRSLSC